MDLRGPTSKGRERRGKKGRGEGKESKGEGILTSSQKIVPELLIVKSGVLCNLSDQIRAV